MEYYNYIKSLHLIFVITWFSGLFYVPRIFIYFIEASKRQSPDKEILKNQLRIMSWRLWYIITWPSAILATFFASWLIFLIPNWLLQSWMIIKIGFVFLLFVYHLKTHFIFLKLQKDQLAYSSFYMRIWNEGATFLLFSIVFLAILKSQITWKFFLTGILFLLALLFIGIKLYRLSRSKSPKND